MKVSVVIMGIIGWTQSGTGTAVVQDASFHASFLEVIGMTGLAFYMFVGSEFIVSFSGEVKHPKRNICLGMVLSLLVVFLMEGVSVFGFANYMTYEEMATSTTPHILYGYYLLGNVGKYWMAIVSVLAVFAFLWIRFHMKKKLFGPVPIHEVMAMENELYFQYHGEKKKSKN